MLLRVLRGVELKDARSLLRHIGQPQMEALIDAGGEKDRNDLFQLAFGFDLNGEDSKEWTTTGLHHAWNVLVQLPDQHVVDQATVKHLVRNQHNRGDSVYDYGQRSVVMSYDWTDAVLSREELGSKKRPEVNCLDEAIRHEFGHALDAKIHASSTYGQTPAGGNWERHGDEPPVKAMAARSRGGIARLALELRLEIMEALISATQSGGDIESALKKDERWSKLSDEQRHEVLADPILKALEHGRLEQKAWDQSRQIVIEGRAYEESNENQWQSYDHAARTRKVSDYQFRSAEEWFAEAYAAYYEPDPRGRGARLADVDPTTKGWFDRNVHAKNNELTADGEQPTPKPKKA
jgi:hypothetical protein